MLRRISGYDTGLVVAVLALLAVSVYLLLYAITGPDGEPMRTFGYRQLVFAILGIVAAGVISRIDLELFAERWVAIYAVAVGCIGVVYVLGTAIRGSRRWIELGPVNLQPSETSKVLLILAISGFLVGRAREVHSLSTFVSTIALCAAPAILVFLQPDFGTSQVYGYICLAVLFFSGARWLHLAMLGGSVVLISVLVLGLLPAVGVHVLHDFQRQRLTGFLNPEADPQGSNYQAIQAKTAIGSGQLTGKSADDASQVRDGFLPEPQTDFVFATLAERHGFVGGALVLGIYLLLLSRCMRAVVVAPTMYGRLVVAAVATMFGAQVLINVGMVIGLMPITGVPLPLVSYGGSAMLAGMAGIGLVANVMRSAETPSVRYARRAGSNAATTLDLLRSPRGGRRQRPRRRPVIRS